MQIYIVLLLHVCSCNVYAFKLIVLYTLFSLSLFLCLDKASRSYAIRFKLLLTKKVR